jgi:hypothetical protein
VNATPLTSLFDISKEFLQEIRKKYPNDYDDLSDNELINLWLRKFSKDNNKVDFKTYGESPIPLKQTKSKSFLSFSSIFLTDISYPQ